MSISGTSSMMNDYAVRDDSPSFKKAIKAYQDERLTGLTDEEREEIKQKCKAYLEGKPVKTKEDAEAFNNYVKSLMKSYGFKGDCEGYASGLANEARETEDSGDTVERPAMTAAEHFDRAVIGAAAVIHRYRDCL